MKRVRLSKKLLLALAVSLPQLFAGGGVEAQRVNVNFKAVARGLVSPVDVSFVRGRSGEMYVLEEAGNVVLFSDGKEIGKLFLRQKGEEQDLYKKRFVNLEFHPAFIGNGKFYLTFTRENASGLSLVLAEFTYEQTSELVDTSTEREIFSIRLPKKANVGGGLAFDPEGRLFLGIGDGGGKHDPDKNGQNPQSLLGSIMRIDVGSNDNSTAEYISPLDNPFVLSGEGKKEIWAYGFRNPVKISRDVGSGDLWMGDRGEDTFEEVNRVLSGKNYGWAAYEGTFCLKMRFECQSSNYEQPLYEYPRDFGSAVTGGYVYRGSAIEQLKGRYIFGDRESGSIWALKSASGEPASNLQIALSTFKISSFGQDRTGEVYVADHNKGKVYKIVPQSSRKAVKKASSLPG